MVVNTGCLRRRILIAAIGLCAVVLVPGIATAHRVDQSRFTAPIPTDVFVLAAGIVVGGTAVVSAILVGDRAPRERTRSVEFTLVPGVRGVVRGLAIVVFGLLIVDGLAGRQVASENLATLVVWPLWFEGLVMVAALVGSPWRLLSPWRSIYDAVSRIEGDRIALAGNYPRFLGVWPATVGFVLLIGVLENLTVVPRSPRSTAVLLVVYTLVMVVGGFAFGREWFANADPIEVVLDLFQRVSPLRWTRHAGGGYGVVIRRPGAGCLEPVSGLGAVVLVVMTVYTVSFDGFTNTPEYQSLLFTTADSLGLVPGVAGILLYIVGGVLFIAGFAAVIGAVASIGRAPDRREVLTSVAPTVIPIAIGYEFAHYTTYVVENAAAVGHVLLGWVMVSPPTFAPLSWLSVRAYWGFVVITIVLGHVVAVVAAHIVTRRVTGPTRAALRAHLPLVLLMVAYTMVSLWIVSRPFVS